MKVTIRAKAIRVDASLRAHVLRRLDFGLGRLAEHIASVQVHLSDLNGPRGGIDKACRLELRLQPTGDVRIEDVDADLLAAIDRAAERAARAVVRHVERARGAHRANAALREFAEQVFHPAPLRRARGAA